MAEFTHRIEPLCTLKPEWGRIAHVLATPDSRSIVLQLEDEHGTCVMFRDRIVSVWCQNVSRKMALSYDGTKLASVTQASTGGKKTHRIHINGELAYTVPLSTVCELAWMDNESLAWSGWNKRNEDGVKGTVDDGGIRYFADGVDRTGNFEFHQLGMARGRRGVLVRMFDRAYRLDNYGHMSVPVTVPVGTPYDRWFKKDFVRDNASRPQKVRDEKLRLMQVCHGDTVGPWFDGLGNEGGSGTYAYNGDRSKVAYIGISYPKHLRSIGNLMLSGLQKQESRTVAGGKSPFWMWPIAFLANPYFGPVQIYAEMSRRLYPVDDGRPWKKGWHHASDHFYLPNDSLAVTCRKSRQERVVIDEQEGPEFDHVQNVEYVAADDAVCYIGRRGNEMFRVSVVDKS